MKLSLILLSAFSIFLASGCSSLQPATTANGETARAECLALKKHTDAIDQRFASRPAIQQAAQDSDQDIAIQLTVVETKDIKTDQPAPKARVLSAAETKTQLSELKRKGKIVCYPRMLTESGKLVTFRSVVNQPILETHSSAPNPDTGDTTAAEIETVPIGTLIGTLPTRLTNDKIQLDLDLTFSEITGTERYEGNPYPLIASRHHTGAYQLAEGETLFLEMPAADAEDTTLKLFATATGIPKS